MKKILLILMLSGCTYTPVVDLRVSGDKAQLYQRDLMECREIIKQITKREWGLAYEKVLAKCLTGRGHSIINSSELPPLIISQM